MKTSFAIALGSAALGAALIAGGVGAQGPPPPAPSGQMPPEQRPRGPMPGGMHGQHHPAAGGQMQPGQDAFAAIAEVVRILEFDPSTDWSKVDLERLRQHLIDMNEVVLRAAVKATPVTGGLAMDITGSGRTAQSIGAMIVPHAAELDRMPAWSAKTEPMGDGVRLIVLARDPSDATTVAKIRALGFAGLLVQGGHHGPHHLAMAKGELPPAHKH
jgi:hypothetical protein